MSTLAAQLFPDHPNLLASTWEPTAAMRADGYVTKPVSGRGGEYPVSTYPTRLHPSARSRCAMNRRERRAARGRVGRDDGEDGGEVGGRGRDLPGAVSTPRVPREYLLEYTSSPWPQVRAA